MVWSSFWCDNMLVYMDRCFLRYLCDISIYHSRPWLTQMKRKCFYLLSICCNFVFFLDRIIFTNECTSSWLIIGSCTKKLLFNFIILSRLAFSYYCWNSLLKIFGFEQNSVLKGKIAIIFTYKIKLISSFWAFTHGNELRKNQVTFFFLYRYKHIFQEVFKFILKTCLNNPPPLNIHCKL